MAQHRTAGHNKHVATLVGDTPTMHKCKPAHRLFSMHISAIPVPHTSPKPTEPPQAQKKAPDPGWNSAVGHHPRSKGSPFSPSPLPLTSFLNHNRNPPAYRHPAAGPQPCCCCLRPVPPVRWCCCHTLHKVEPSVEAGSGGRREGHHKLTSLL